MAEYPLDFFLAANSTQGFVSRFDQLGDHQQGWRSIIIKGVPGCGKSTLMRQAAQAMAECGEAVEQIHCSSDPDSLDGVILENLRVSVADGTAPHVLEPRYPGAFERVLNLFDALDMEELYRCREEIIDLFDQNHALYERAYRFFSAAGSLQSDSSRLGTECLNLVKLNKTALRMARQEFAPARARLSNLQNENAGKEKIRFLSAVSKDGVIFYEQTVKKLCSRIYLLIDEVGCPGKYFLSALRSLALSAKQQVISCYCPLRPFDKLEHLLIPSAGVGFITSNSFHKPELPIEGVINCRRFLDQDLLRDRKQKLTFNRRATRELLTEGQRIMGEAKTVHDKLERCYHKAVDFSIVDRKLEELLNMLSFFREERAGKK